MALVSELRHGARVQINGRCAHHRGEVGELIWFDGDQVTVRLDIGGDHNLFANQVTVVEEEPVATREESQQDRCKHCGLRFWTSESLRLHWETEHRQDVLRSSEFEVGDRVRSISPFFHMGKTGVVKRVIWGGDHMVEVRLDDQGPKDMPKTFYAKSLEKLPTESTLEVIPSQQQDPSIEEMQRVAGFLRSEGDDHTADALVRHIRRLRQARPQVSD